MPEYKSTRITRQTEKTFDDGNISYSFQAEATGQTWIRAGKERYKGTVEVGNLVDLTTSTAQKRGATSPTTYCDKVVLVSGTQSAADNSGGFGAGGFKAQATGNAGQTGYDVRQTAIQYQSARNAAIEYLKLVVGSNALKLPESPAKRLKVLDSVLDGYTAQFHTDVDTQGAVKRVSQEEETEVPTAAATKGEDDDE